MPHDQVSAPRITDDWIGALRTLPDNWDSYGSPKISEAAIEAVKLFFVVPANDGGIQLEAHFGGKDFELTITPEGKIGSIYLAEAPMPTTKEIEKRAHNSCVNDAADRTRKAVEDPAL